MSILTWSKTLKIAVFLLSTARPHTTYSLFTFMPFNKTQIYRWGEKKKGSGQENNNSPQDLSLLLLKWLSIVTKQSPFQIYPWGARSWHKHIRKPQHKLNKLLLDYESANWVRLNLFTAATWKENTYCKLRMLPSSSVVSSAVFLAASLIPLKHIEKQKLVNKQWINRAHCKGPYNQDIYLFKTPSEIRASFGWWYL